MPHIAVMMYPGRDEEAKKNLAKKIQNLVMEEFNLPEAVVSVSMNDIEKEAFPDKVITVSNIRKGSGNIGEILS